MPIRTAVVIAVADRLAMGYCIRSLLRSPTLESILIVGPEGRWAERYGEAHAPKVRWFASLTDLSLPEHDTLVTFGHVVVSTGIWSIEGAPTETWSVLGCDERKLPAPPQGQSIDTVFAGDRQASDDPVAAMAVVCADAKAAQQAALSMIERSYCHAFVVFGAGYAQWVSSDIDWPSRAFRSPYASSPNERRLGPAVWESGRALRDAWHKKSLGAALQGAVDTLPNLLASQSDALADSGQINPRFRVTYVVEKLVIAGGVLSVIQLVNELVLLGVDARIATLFEDPKIYRWSPLLSRPMVFDSYQDLAERIPECDVAVATLWSTAQPVADLLPTGRAKQVAYFLQDYEAWFFPEDAEEQRKTVIDSYSLIPHRIVKSQWLQDQLADLGHACEIIGLGMSLDVFSPASDGATRPAGVLAMFRPGTRYRGANRLVEVLAQVHQRLPQLSITLFGDDSKIELPFPAVQLGVVADRQQLADCYRAAQVFIDLSDHQAFGRCGLEAMACGTPAVLTHHGGVTEYGRHGHNSLLVGKDEIADAVSAVVQLVENSSLRDQFGQNGISTAARFDVTREARESLTYFQAISSE